MAKKLTKKQINQIKKTVVKHPKGGIIITIIILLALIAGALYYFLVLNKPETYFKLKGPDTVSVALKGTYKEKGFECFYKNEDVSSSVTTTYYDSNNQVVTSIDTSKEATFTAKYVADSKYSFENNTLTRTINVTAVEPILISFLELGNKYTGDSIYIKAGETDILIDAGSQKNSATAISNYVNQHCTDGKLEYVIATHAHEDHIAAFVGSKTDGTGIFNNYKIDTLIDFARTDSTTQLYADYVSIRDSKLNSGDISHHYTALDCWKECNGAKKSYDLGAGISMDILYQKYYEESAPSKNENNYSVCLMINQGDNHYLFTGDLEAEGEESLVASNNLPEVELFKAAHHGSYTANTDELLSVIKPENVVVCCSAGNTKYTDIVLNTFPSQTAINNFAKYTDKIYVTTVDYGDSYGPLNGTVEFSCNSGTNYTITGSNNSTILKNSDWFKQNRTWPTV